MCHQKVDIYSSCPHKRITSKSRCAANNVVFSRTTYCPALDVTEMLAGELCHFCREKREIEEENAALHQRQMAGMAELRAKAAEDRERDAERDAEWKKHEHGWADELRHSFFGGSRAASPFGCNQSDCSSVSHLHMRSFEDLGGKAAARETQVSQSAVKIKVNDDDDTLVEVELDNDLNKGGDSDETTKTDIYDLYGDEKDDGEVTPTASNLPYMPATAGASTSSLALPPYPYNSATMGASTSTVVIPNYTSFRPGPGGAGVAAHSTLNLRDMASTCSFVTTSSIPELDRFGTPIAGLVPASLEPIFEPVQERKQGGTEPLGPFSILYPDVPELEGDLGKTFTKDIQEPTQYQDEGSELLLSDEMERTDSLFLPPTTTEERVSKPFLTEGKLQELQHASRMSSGPRLRRKESLHIPSKERVQGLGLFPYWAGPSSGGNGIHDSIPEEAEDDNDTVFTGCESTFVQVAFPITKPGQRRHTTKSLASKPLPATTRDDRRALPSAAAAAAATATSNPPPPPRRQRYRHHQPATYPPVPPTLPTPPTATATGCAPLQMAAALAEMSLAMPRPAILRARPDSAPAAAAPRVHWAADEVAEAARRRHRSDPAGQRRRGAVAPAPEARAVRQLVRGGGEGRKRPKVVTVGSLAGLFRADSIRGERQVRVDLRRARTGLE